MGSGARSSTRIPRSDTGGSVARKVSFWAGKGFFIETIEDNDESFHLVISTPDLQNREQAAQTEQFFINFITTQI
jgi:hypothetical protein